MTKLVHIAKIEQIQASELLGLVIIKNASCKLPQGVNFSEIEDIHGLVGAKIEDEEQHGQKVYTTTVTFQTGNKTPGDKVRQAYRLTSIDGTQFLVGTDSRPYAICKENNAFPEKPGDSDLKTVTITWKAPLPMLTIL